MIMKFYGCFVLLVLVLSTGSSYGRDFGGSEDELDQMRRNLAYRRNFNKRLQTKERNSHAGSPLYAAKKGAVVYTDIDDSAPESVENPVRISIFNAGDYDAHLKVNYVIDNLQQEQELASDIKQGEHRSVFMPITATYIRIRIDETGSDEQVITDQQIRSLNGTTGFCYLLAHDQHHPVYGICPSTYVEMLNAWEH